MEEMQFFIIHKHFTWHWSDFAHASWSAGGKTDKKRQTWSTTAARRTGPSSNSLPFSVSLARKMSGLFPGYVFLCLIAWVVYHTLQKKTLPLFWVFISTVVCLLLGCLVWLSVLNFPFETGILFYCVSRVWWIPVRPRKKTVEREFEEEALEGEWQHNQMLMEKYFKKRCRSSYYLSNTSTVFYFCASISFMNTFLSRLFLSPQVFRGYVDDPRNTDNVRIFLLTSLKFRSIDRLHWLIDWFICKVGRAIDRLIDCLIEGFPIDWIGCSIDWLIDCLKVVLYSRPGWKQLR